MSHLDEAVPHWHFRERHQTKIAASPERIFEAIRAVRAEDILFFRTMVAIRRLGRDCEESILNPPRGVPILDVATRTGFFYVADDPPREVVIGIHVASGVFAAMNFLVDGTTLSTETRVMARTLRGRIAFGLYWFAIRAGSGIIRRMWLRAIKRRAEGTLA